MSVNKPSRTFVGICQIAGMTDGQIWTNWWQITERSVMELWHWLIQENWLTEEQRQKMTVKMQNSENEGGIDMWCEAIFDGENLEKIRQKYLFIAENNQKSYYRLLSELMNLDQKDAVKLFLKKI